MALLFMDSCDHYATADILEKWTGSAVAGAGGTVTIGATGRRGSGAVRWTTGTATVVQGYVARSVVAADTTCILGFALNVSVGQATITATQIAAVRDNLGVPHILCRVNTDLTVSVGRWSAGSFTNLGTSSASLLPGVFTYVEWRVKIDPTTGTVDLWFNGNSVVSVTNANTRGQAGSSWGSVSLGQDSSQGSSNLSPGRTFEYDDIYVLDGSGAAPWNARLGDVRVDARFPTGAGATTGWTPSAGANWAAVDDAAPNDDTDTVTAATAGLTDTYVVQDAPVVGGTILGVQVNVNAKKSDAGTCTLAPVIRHAGTDQVGTAVGPGTAYAYTVGVYPTNPGTAAAWTEADFNAAEFGVRKVS